MLDRKAGEGAPEAPEKQSARYRTQELGRLLSYYKKNIRDYHYTEANGVIRNIQRLIDKGLALEDIVQAMENYAADEYRKSSDPRFTLSVRSFFSEAKIREWLNPVERKPMKPMLPQINFEPLVRPTPVNLLTEREEENDIEL
jgi:hypothetical protein